MRRDVGIMETAVLILAGGRGARLWPLSRPHRPKPFIRIGSDKYSLLQRTILRALKIVPPENIFICVNQRHVGLAKQQIGEITAGIPEKNIIAEPAARDTLPAVTFSLMQISGDPTIVLMPADHYIVDDDGLTNAIEMARRYADKYIVALGVVPTTPDTGYGYLEVGQRIDEGIYRILSFKEKPDARTAEEYVDRGFLWNTFIHVFRKSLMLEEIKKYAREIYRTLEKYRDSPEMAYAIISPASLSDIVLQRTQKNAVIPVRIAWNDVGSFDRIYTLIEKDENGNAANTELIALDAKNNYVQSEKKTVSILGLSNIFVIETEDAILIGRMDRAQEVKRIAQLVDEWRDKEEKIKRK